MNLAAGLAVGKLQDFSALVLLQCYRPSTDRAQMAPREQWRSPYRLPEAETTFVARDIGRLPLGTKHTETALRVAEVKIRSHRPLDPSSFS